MSKGKVTLNLVGQPLHHPSIAGSFLAHSVNIIELLCWAYQTQNLTARNLFERES